MTPVGMTHGSDRVHYFCQTWAPPPPPKPSLPPATLRKARALESSLLTPRTPALLVPGLNPALLGMSLHGASCQAGIDSGQPPLDPGGPQS